MANLKVINVIFTMSCFLGLALSIFSYVVEQAVEKDENYQAVCDLTDFVSCTKVYKSEYARGFGIFAKFFGEDSVLNNPNSLVGMIFYSLLIVFAQLNSKPFVFLSFLGCLAAIFISMYLGIVLVFYIKSICIFCIGMYVLNAINLLCSYYKCKTVFGTVSDTTSKKKKRV